MPKTRMLAQHKLNDWKDMIKGKKQVSIKHFFTKKGKESDKFHLLPQKAASEATHCEATLSMQDQICKRPCEP